LFVNEIIVEPCVSENNSHGGGSGVSRKRKRTNGGEKARAPASVNWDLIN
jgi:hypothetical protein